MPQGKPPTGFAARRFDVPPGITGLWQVSGRSGLTYDDLRFLDTLYVSSWSFWWDLRVLGINTQGCRPRSCTSRSRW
ncbi:MAG: sugar transferase, partial [Frankiaceae bacterium]